jgi:hypothetical protein
MQLRIAIGIDSSKNSVFQNPEKRLRERIASAMDAFPSQI